MHGTHRWCNAFDKTCNITEQTSDPTMLCWTSDWINIIWNLVQACYVYATGMWDTPVWNPIIEYYCSTLLLNTDTDMQTDNPDVCTFILIINVMDCVNLQHCSVQCVIYLRHTGRERKREREMCMSAHQPCRTKKQQPEDRRESKRNECERDR